MPDERRIAAEQYEKAISLVEGVVSSKVVLGQNGEVTEMHILANSSRNPKQIVRDVETACMIHFGVAIDHKKVSVAQLHTELPDPGWKRMIIQAISYHLREGNMDVTVDLALGGRTETGKASGIRTETMELRLVAEATLAAIQRFLSKSNIFGLENAAIVPFSGRDAAMVGITFVNSGVEEHLVGSSYLRSDYREAIVRATLDAVNRKILNFLSE